MEIEAKFAVPDVATYERLQACRELAGFTVVPGPTVSDQDQYLDTPDGRFLAAGYACRMRAEGDAFIMTLKGLGAAGGAIHRRDEREVRLDEPDLNPEHWPDGPARWLASELTAGHPLEPLLALRQERARRTVMDGQRLLGEFTADAVEVMTREPVPDGPERYFELEIELKGDGTEDDLERLARELQEGWGLPPEPRSKFERALTTLWARYPELKPPAGGFQAPAEGSNSGRAAPDPPGAPPSPPAGAQRRRGPGRRGQETLAPEEVTALQTYAGSPRRPLARRANAVLSWAGGLSTRDVAALTGMSAGRVRYWIRSWRARRLAIFRRQAKDDGFDASQERTSLSAYLVETPGASDHVSTGTPEVEAAQPGDGAAASIEEARPGAAQEPEAASAPAGPETPAAPVLTLDQPPPPLTADEPMSEAGRKLMLLQFQKMCQHEPGTRSGEDPEALHDMRVATRRLRAAYLLFEPYFDQKAMGQFNKRLRRTGRALGVVRDLDVLIGKAERYAEGQPAEKATSLQPLLDSWRQQRDGDRVELIEYLDHGKYQDFRDDFGAFLTTPGAGVRPIPSGEPVAYQVRHVVPRLLWERYEDVRAYEPALAQAPLTTYHQLRITCKKLRYAMEFFRDILGESAGSLIKKVTAIQDLLGDLHDATVAEELVAAFLNEQVQQHASTRDQAPLDGVTAYLMAQWAIERDLLARFPGLWAEIIGYEFRKGFSLAVAAL